MYILRLVVDIKIVSVFLMNPGTSLECVDLRFQEKNTNTYLQDYLHYELFGLKGDAFKPTKLFDK